MVRVNTVIATANDDKAGPEIDSHASKEEAVFPAIVQAGDVR
jgi:hypothetical protein